MPDAPDWGAPQTDSPVNVPGVAPLDVPSPTPEPLQVPDAEGRLLAPDEVPVPGVHYVEWESRDWGVVRGCQLSESEYVRSQIEQTRLTVDRFGIRDEVLTPKGTYVSVPKEHRLDRAASHARWRYRGYLAGEVSSL